MLDDKFSAIGYELGSNGNQKLFTKIASDEESLRRWVTMVVLESANTLIETVIAGIHHCVDS